MRASSPTGNRGTLKGGAAQAGPARGRSDPWRRELGDFARAFGSAFLFGMPMLYTLEMWELGTYTPLWKLLLYIGLAFGINVVLAHFSGFKQQRTLAASLMQALDAMAVGVVASLAILLILNRIQAGDPLASSLGRIVIQMVPFSIGACVANAVFAEHHSRQGQEDVPTPRDPVQALLNDVGATIGGGLFIGFSIAPTEEVRLVAAQLSVWHALALMVFSLLVTYLLVFASAFRPQSTRAQWSFPFQQPLAETALAYVVSLALAGVVLALFNQIETTDSLRTIISRVLVLGLPVSLGGAAGRVLL